MSDSDGDFSDELLELAGAGEKKRKKSSSSRSHAKRRKADLPKSDSEQEYESEEDDLNPYPLEGKFLDEADRERLLQLPEVVRENILAQRLDEMQRFQDKRNLDQMLREQRGETDSVSKAAKRAHPVRGATKEKTRKLDELKAKRKAKSEKKRTKISSPKRDRSSSPMDMEMSSEDEEDGQISKQQQQEERESRLLSKSNPDADDITFEDLERCRLSRNKLASYAMMPWFEEYVRGSWVRYLIGPGEDKQPVYRICEVMSVAAPCTKAYKIGSNFFDTSLELRYGNAVKPWAMDKVSNGSITEDEFRRLKSTCQYQKCKLPTKRALEKKEQQLVDLPMQRLTEADVSAMVSEKRRLDRNVPNSRASLTKKALERSELVQKRKLAQMRRDYTETAQIDSQLAELDNAFDSYPVEEKEDILEKVNERNRQANREAVRRAEAAEAERKRKAWMTRAAANSRPGTPGNLKTDSPGGTPSGTPKFGATLGVTDADEKRSVSPLPGNGPLGKRTFASIVANSVEIDLGDF